MSRYGAGAGTNSIFPIAVFHQHSSGLDGLHSVLVVMLDPDQTVDSIVEWIGGVPGGDGGWTYRDDHTAQSRTMWVYDKIMDSSEPSAYFVDFSPQDGSHHVAQAFLVDFATAGTETIRAIDYADTPSALTLTLPSLTASNPDDLWALVWSQEANPLEAGNLKPDSPLSTSGNKILSGTPFIEESVQTWQSSSATGTRSYSAASGSPTVNCKAAGVIMLIGSSGPTGGGWGVGFVRMGAN